MRGSVEAVLLENFSYSVIVVCAYNVIGRVALSIVRGILVINSLGVGSLRLYNLKYEVML